MDLQDQNNRISEKIFYLKTRNNLKIFSGFIEMMRFKYHIRDIDHNNNNIQNDNQNIVVIVPLISYSSCENYVTAFGFDEQEF